jgi:aspartate aminotransferase
VQPHLSARVQRTKPSQTVTVTARAGALRAEGRDVIGLGVGEPDFDTPAHIKKAAIAAINDGFTKYTPVDGTPELKDAIARKLRRDNGLQYDRAQILVSSGGKQSLYNLFQAVLDRGDEVIIPAPYWVSYPDMARLADATPVAVFAGREAGFRISPEQLDAAITPRTRLFVINSPCNPTGAAYSAAQLQALGEVLSRHPQILVVTDDLYEHIYWANEPFSNILMACPSLYERTVVVNGVSKGYAMTGWRIGYAAGPEPIIKAMTKIQGQSTTTPCSISQVAAATALDGDHGCVRSMRDAFRARHDFVIPALDALPGFACGPAQGAFYSFIDCRGAISALPGIDDDVTLCEMLLERANVALVPGVAFGAPGHLRLSYAASQAVLEDAIGRITVAMATHRA